MIIACQNDWADGCADEAEKDQEECFQFVLMFLCAINDHPRIVYRKVNAAQQKGQCDGEGHGHYDDRAEVGGQVDEGLITSNQVVDVDCEGAVLEQVNVF